MTRAKTEKEKINFQKTNILEGEQKESNDSKLERAKEKCENNNLLCKNPSKSISRLNDSRVEETQKSRNVLESVELVLTDNQTERDRILIIDNIEEPNKYRASSQILKEIKTFAPNIKVVYAYSLSRGGIAVHLQTSEDRDLLLNTLPPEAFGKGKKKSLDKHKIVTTFIKDIDTRHG